MERDERLALARLKLRQFQRQRQRPSSGGEDGSRTAVAGTTTDVVSPTATVSSGASSAGGMSRSESVEALAVAAAAATDPALRLEYLERLSSVLTQENRALLRMVAEQAPLSSEEQLASKSSFSSDSAAREEIDRLTLELSMQRAKNADLSSRLLSLRSAEAEMSDDRSLAMFELQLHERNQSLQQLNEDVGALAAEKQQLMEEFEQMKRLHNDTIDRLEEAERERDAAIKANANALDSERKRSAELQQRLDTTEADLQRERAATADLKRRHDEASADALKQRERVADVHQRHAAAAEDAERLSTLLQEQHTLAHRFQSEKQAADAAHAKELAKVQAQTNALEAELNEKRAQIHALDSTLGKLKDSVQRSRNELAASVRLAVEPEIAGLKRELESTRKKLAERDETLTEVRRSLGAQLTDVQRRLDGSEVAAREKTLTLAQRDQLIANVRGAIENGTTLSKEYGIEPTAEELSLDDSALPMHVESLTANLLDVLVTSRSEAADLRKQLQCSLDERESLAEANARQESLIQTTTNQSRYHENEARTFQQRLVELESALGQLTTRHQATVQLTKRQLSTLKSTVDELLHKPAGELKASLLQVMSERIADMQLKVIAVTSGGDGAAVASIVSADVPNEESIAASEAPRNDLIVANATASDETNEMERHMLRAHVGDLEAQLMELRTAHIEFESLSKTASQIQSLCAFLDQHPKFNTLDLTAFVAGEHVSAKLVSQLTRYHEQFRADLEEKRAAQDTVRRLTEQRDTLLQQYQAAINNEHESPLEQLRMENEEMLARSVALTNQLEDVTTQWKRACETINKKNAEIEELGARIAAGTDNVESLGGEIEKLQALLNLEKQTRRQLELELAQNSDEHRKLSETLERERETAKATIDTLERMMSDEKERAHRLAESVANLQQMLSEVSARNNAPMEMLQVVEAQKDNLFRQLDARKKELEMLKQQLARANDSSQQQELELATERDEKDSMIKFIREMLGTLPDVKVTATELFALDRHRLFDRFKNELNMMMRKQMTSAPGGNRSLEESVHGFKQRITELNEENAKYGARCEELTTEVERLRGEMQERDLMAKVNGVHEGATAADFSLPLDQRTIDQYESIIRSLRKEQRSAEERLTELTRQSSDPESAIYRLSTEKDTRIVELELELAMLKRENEEFELLKQPSRFGQPGGTNADNYKRVAELQHKLAEQESKLDQARLVEIQCRAETELVRSRIAANESSLIQAERTIELLKNDLARRDELNEALKQEKSALTKEVDDLRRNTIASALPSAGSEDVKSPGPEQLLMDRIVDRASGTAQFLDRVATSNLVLVSDELIHRLSEQVDGVKEIAFANYVDLDNITSTLVTPELKALQKELAKQKQTVIAVQALIKEMATSEGRRDPASALFVRLTKESPTTQIHGDTMLLQNNKEIDVLRETIKKMTEAEEYLKHSPKDEEQKLAHALLQSHIAQLRKIWEHEVKANEVLRRILAEVRSKHESNEKEFLREIERLHYGLSTANTKSEELRLAADQSSRALKERKLTVEQLESECHELRTSVGIMRRDWQVERTELLGKLDRFIRDIDVVKADRVNQERTWDATREGMDQELHRAKLAMEKMQQNASIRSADAIKRLAADYAHKEEAWRTERELLKKELTDVRRRFDEAVQKHRGDVESMLGQRRDMKRAAREAVPSDVVESMVEELKRKSRAEKEELLQRFKEKVQEYEQVFDRQMNTIERLKSENNGRGDNEELHQLRTEIVHLRETIRQSEDAVVRRNASDDVNDVELMVYRERERHREHCKTLVAEISILRLKYRREAGYRADLIYQKHYLVLLMGGVKNIGYPEPLDEAPIFGVGRTPSQRLRRACIFVLAAARMKILSRKWSSAKSQVKQTIKKHRLASSTAHVAGGHVAAGGGTELATVLGRSLGAGVGKERGELRKLQRDIDRWASAN